MRVTAIGPDGAEFIDVAAAAVRTEEEGLPATGQALSALIWSALGMLILGSVLLLATKRSVIHT